MALSIMPRRIGSPVLTRSQLQCRCWPVQMGGQEVYNLHSKSTQHQLITTNQQQQPSTSTTQLQPIIKTVTINNYHRKNGQLPHPRNHPSRAGSLHCAIAPFTSPYFLLILTYPSRRHASKTTAAMQPMADVQMPVCRLANPMLPTDLTDER